MTTFVRSAAVLVLVATSVFRPSVVRQASYAFEKVAEGVYVGTPTLPGRIECNVLVVVGDEDVVLMDGGAEQEMASRLLVDLKTITSKPVRYVVNSHFHFDHAGANEGFGPEVKIVTSEYTAARLAGDPYAGVTFTRFFGAGGYMPQRIAGLTGRLDQESDPARRDDLRLQINSIKDQMTLLKTARPRTADVVVKNTYVIPRAAGEIQVLYLGRAHTAGDLMVYLPKEGIVATGDAMGSGLPYMGDAYLDDWPATLESLKRLRFDLVVGGHGPVFRGTEKITAFQGYLRALAMQAAAWRKQGLSPEDAAGRIDLSAFKSEFPQAASGAPLPAVIRYYELLSGRDTP